MQVLLILSPITNFIINSSCVVELYSSTRFLVFQVSVKGWKNKFSFNSQKLVFKEKRQKWPFFSSFTPNVTVSCMWFDYTHYKEIFSRISLIISEIEGNYRKCCVFWKFVLKIFPPRLLLSCSDFFSDKLDHVHSLVCCFY